MHWLEEWRKKHRMSRETLAKQVEVSEHLIWILENEKDGRTHPLIADDIADYTGATIEQRDSIVHKRHRGTYVPNPGKREKKRRIMVKPTPSLETEREHVKEDGRLEKGRTVYAVNKDGEIVQQYASMAEAALRTGMDKSSVYTRCRRKLAENEFLVSEITFRYADEYDEAAKAAVIVKGFEARAQQAKGAWRYGAHWYLNINGETKTLRQWAQESGIKSFTLLGRIQRGMKPEDAIRFKDMRGGARR